MASNSDSILSKINTPFFSEGAKLVGILYELYVADERIEDILNTIRHITLNVENVRRLRSLNAGHLNTHDLTWIDRLISATEDAIGGLAKLVERARVDKETKGNLSWVTKGGWVVHYKSKVKEKYEKLTMCHQSLLSVFPILFKDHGGLPSVLEETKEDEQRPCDPNMMKWLGWQDQRQRRKSTMSLKKTTLPQRPLSASSSSTDMTLDSAVSSNSSASSGPTSSEASSPRGSEIRISCYPATFAQYCSPTSATVSPETDEVSSGTYNEDPFSRSRNSLQSSGSPELVTDSLGSTYPAFHNKFEDNYDPPSALPEDDTEGRNDKLAPISKPSIVSDGADGLQVYIPPYGSELLPDWAHQLQTSPPDGQIARSSKTTSIERRSDSKIDSAEAIRRGRAFAMPSKAKRGDNPTDTEQEATSGPPLHFPSYLPPFAFERAECQNTPSVAEQDSEVQTLNASEDGDELSLEGNKPPMERAHSDTYTLRYSVGGRPGFSPSCRVAAAPGGDRSLSAGQRGARRGSRSWLAFHSSRSDLSRSDGWGEG